MKSDENMDVKKRALSLACDYATQKQLYEIIDYILQNKLQLKFRWIGNDPNFERVILWAIYNRENIFEKLNK